MKLCPADIEVLLHYYTSPYPWSKEHTGDPLEICLVYLAHGIFEKIDGDYGKEFTVTMKGAKWIEMILSTPFPEFRWVDPREKSR